MTDYAARRNAAIDAVLAEIDTVTACMGCGETVPDDGPSDLFCSGTCQRDSLRTQGDGAAWPWWTDDLSGQETPMRWRPDEPDQIERSETNHAHETLEPYLQRHIEPASHSWRYEHLPQRRQGGPVRITVDGESYDCDASSITWTGFGDNETVPMSSRWSITPTWRMPEVRPTPLGERMADVIREMCEALDSGIAASIRSLVERTDHPESPPHNPHLRMPADDPRRAILHRVQNRNTGPAKTPFTKRGRR